MLKIMRSHKLKRFIAVLFILLSVFSMCFSVAAKAEAVTLGVGTIVVLGTMLAACGIKYANSADLNRGVTWVYNNLSDAMKTVLSGLVSLCEGYQTARLQIPFSVFDSFAKLFAALFPSPTVEGSNSPVYSASLLTGLSTAREVSYGADVYIAPSFSDILSGASYSYSTSGVECPPGATLNTSWGSISYSFKAKVEKDSSDCVVKFTPYVLYTVTFVSEDSLGGRCGFTTSSYAYTGYDTVSRYVVSVTNNLVQTRDYLFSLPTVYGEYFLLPTFGYLAGSVESGPSACCKKKYLSEQKPMVDLVDITWRGVTGSAEEICPSFDANPSSDLRPYAMAWYQSALRKNEDVLNYGVSRNPALTTNPDCTVPQTVDGSKDVYMDIPALKDTSLDDLITKNPADVATPADTKVDNPTLVEGADTNVGEGDVTVPADASWLDKILAWLKALLDGILSIPGVISKGIAGVLEGIKAIPAAFAKWFESIIEGIKAIGLSFTDWLSKLIEGFKSLLLSLFEPTISLDEAFAALKAKALAKFPTDGLIDSISAFRDYLSGLGDTPPSFTFVYMGNTCTIAPFDWLSGYRRYWIAFASFFMWFGFIRRTIKRMPQLLGGIT